MPDKRPNILFVLTDQQRPEWVEMNPDIPVRTPASAATRRPRDLARQHHLPVACLRSFALLLGGWAGVRSHPSMGQRYLSP